MPFVYAGSVDGDHDEVYKTYPVANGVTVTAGDAVYFSGGRVTNATIAGARLLGVAVATVVGNAAGTNKVMVNVSPESVYLVDCSAALASSNVGQFFAVQGTTGAQQLNQGSASNTAGALFLLEFGTDLTPATPGTKGLVVIAQHLFHQ